MVPPPPIGRSRSINTDTADWSAPAPYERPLAEWHGRAPPLERPQGVIRDDQPDTREGQAGRREEADRFMVPTKPGMLVEGRDLGSRRTQYVVRDLEIG